MTRQRFRPGRSSLIWMPFVLLACGCMGGPQSNSSMASEQSLVTTDLPQYSKNHVYVFLVQGLDPFDMANLGGVREYLISQGFIKTYLGAPFYAPWFSAEIRRLHQEDPEARFVLVGHGQGANLARAIARSVQQDRASVDLLISINADAVEDSTRPANVAQVVNIQRRGSLEPIIAMSGTDEAQYANQEGIAIGPNALSMELFSRSLASVACRVPIRDTVLESVATGPTPRPCKEVAQVEVEDKEWGFLHADVMTRVSPIASNPVMSFTGQSIAAPVSHPTGNSPDETAPSIIMPIPPARPTAPVGPPSPNGPPRTIRVTVTKTP
jgi:hypothetical protein